MSLQAILLPLFVEVILTFVVMFGMMYHRTSALQKGEARYEDIALREPNWPVRATQFANSYANQFELPLLFYVLTILEIVTRTADLLFVALAWIFVFMRILQAAVHVTNNDVRFRGAFYGLGAAVLAIMWGVFIVRILITLP
ncbi:MAG TPA: MAPEG family protein [Pseudolabrys sp.]|nr:MAPEG family protein [Pseudolabrys sp.]